MKKISSRILLAILSCTLATSISIGGFTYLNSIRYIHGETGKKMGMLSKSLANEFSQRFIAAETSVDFLHAYVTATFALESAIENKEYLSAYEKETDALLRAFTRREHHFQGIYFTFNPELNGSLHEVWFLDLEGSGNFKRVDNRLFNQFSETPYTGDAAYPSITAFYPKNQGMGYYYGALEREGGYWYEPDAEPGLPLTILGYSRAARQDDVVIGVAGIDINIEDIKRSIAGMKPGGEGYAFLMTPDLKVITHPELEEGFDLLKTGEETYSLLSKISGDAPYSVLTGTEESRRTLYSSSALSNGWILVLVTDWKEIVRPLNELSLAIGFLTLLILAISVTAAYYLSNRISIPVEAAADHLRHLELGEFNHQIPVELLKRNDDLGDFIKSIHTMKSVIKELLKEIEVSAGKAHPVRALVNRMADETLKASDEAASAIEGIARESAQTEEILNKTTNWLLKAQEAGHIGSWEHRESNLHWSPEMFRILGFDGPKAPPAATFFDRIYKEDRLRFEKALAGGRKGRAYGVEFRFEKFSGGMIWLNQMGESVRDKSGRVLYSYGICQDISERKETLSRLESLNKDLYSMVEHEVEKNRQKDAALLYQSRLAKMGEMIAHIAHQWRQPLNNLSLILSNIGETKDDPSQREELDRAVRRSGQIIQSMSSTIEAFRNFLNPKGKAQLFSLHKTLVFATDLMENSIHINKIRLTLNCRNDSEIFGHPQEFAQVVSNILYNARDALLSISPEERRIDVIIDRSGREAFVEIVNNGPPISGDALENLFKPYFTTKSEGKGTGIGLYMSRIIIEEHLGGMISLQNEAEYVICRISIPIYCQEENHGSGTAQLQTTVR